MVQTDVDSRPRDGVTLADQWDNDPADLIETPIAVPTVASGHPDRTKQAGHMTASDQRRPDHSTLASRGPSTHGPAIHAPMTDAAI